jgi:hypothetical protein
MKKIYTPCAMLVAFALTLFSGNLFSQCTLNCGTGADGAYLATSSTSIVGGTYNYTSFTINSGAIVTVTGTQPLIIYCTGNVVIDGGLSASGGAGGNGVTFSTYGVGGIGIAGGANGGDGVFLGSGAAGQNGLGLGAGTGGLGWSGGGGAGFTAVGANSGGGGGFGGPVYGTPNLSPVYGGSGGGGGSGGNNCGSGGGGGGGGIIQIQACGSITIGAAGQVRANGGNGGSDGTGNCGSGAGGSGGSIWLSSSGTITNNGSVMANGGVGGSTTIPGPPYYGVGGTGSVGRIRCDYATLNGSGTFSPAVGYTGTLLGVAMSSANISCNGGSNGSATATVSGGTAPYTYSWSPSGGTSATASGLSAGTYSCTVVDNAGCTSIVTVTITQPAAMTVTTAQTNASCNGGNNGDAMVTPSGGASPYTYAWSPSGGTGSMAMNLTAGTYTCTITDANGCTTTQPFTITQPSALTAITTTTQNLCNGQCNASATVAPSGGTPGYTYGWSPNVSTQATVTALCAGTYTCTITDANGCVTTQIASIVDPSPVTGTSTTVMPTCSGGNDGSATVSASGGTPGYTYLWSSGGTAATETGLSAGTYTCTITDANGCTSAINVVINNPAAITANPSSQNASCFGSTDGWIAVNPVGGSGPYTYLWVPNLNTNDTITNISAGCYTVTITDANGCTSSQTVCITSPPQIVPVIAQNNSPSCFGDCNGAATVTASGGTGPLTWLWSPSGCTMQSCVGLCAGTYSISITDSTGCSTTVSLDLTQPNQLTATASHTDESLASANDGTATATPSGGTPGYTYSWAPSGGTSQTATGLDAGTYTCTITDANGCTTTVTVTVGTTNGVGIATVTDPDFSVNLFPNPANDHVQLSVTLAQKGNVTMEVYNLVGEKIDAIDFGNVSSINHAYNTTSLANGVYFFRVSSGTYITTRRITVSH